MTVRLPQPTGPYRIGLTSLYLVDRARPDPWDAALPFREVMATVFYPARSGGGGRRAPQMTPGAARAFADFVPFYLHPQLPKEGVDWAATLTHAHSGAPALPGRRPVLIYSPGGGDSRNLGTITAEELASHGWVVVTVDHPGDASEVEFPGTTEYRDETVRGTALRSDPRQDPETFRTMIGTRVADLRFVLDELHRLEGCRIEDAAGRGLPYGLDRVLDLRRAGVYGHSAGGTAAAQAMYEDHRVNAAINLEGYLDHPPPAPGTEGEPFPVARHGVDRPLLLAGTDGFPGREAMERSWSPLLNRPGGRTQLRRIEHATHGVFTDYAAMAPQLERAGLMSAAARTELVGPLDPAEAVPLVRDCVRSFFTRHCGV
ncbi:alpha/beta hydrolase family protein [Streptomyces monticola]|uniref:Alpha/beta hydrolase family protein n=1 Tax=Streptomyces monticola TaxID=2666263 RepID=A0ABW2JEJ5_9ACTN